MNTAHSWRVGLVQCNSSRVIEDNFAPLERAIRQAATDGADFIATPENCVMMEPNRDRALATARTAADHPALPFFAGLARETGAMILAGSIGIKLEAETGNDSPPKLANRSYVFAGGSGEIIAEYNKIHLFDVTLGSGEVYRESALYEPGTEAVLVKSSRANIGLTICYDLRFAALYRLLAKMGAEVLCVPAAFTAITGRAHWHSLLRARAIETGCFVLAPAQVGVHAEGRETYGHSLVVSPWGEVLADGGEAPGVTVIDLDLSKVAEARSKIPALLHDREFALKITNH
ncbi:MAG: carbon-nitrogen hydrolase family protein [Candidatus Pacebacteria bacterium]|nr:carbon-nitrogen hydrolase family protein [Candidatus Paceibacterota bacterium]